MGPKKGPTGGWPSPCSGDKRLPGIAAEDIGKCAYGIFKKGREYIGKRVGIAGGHLTGAQMAAAFSRALGQEVRYNEVSPEVYRGFGFPGADDLGNMFQFKRISRRNTAGPQHRGHTLAQSRAADFRAVAGEEQERHTRRLMRAGARAGRGQGRGRHPRQSRRWVPRRYEQPKF